jgi:hypothetical protein
VAGNHWPIRVVPLDYLYYAAFGNGKISAVGGTNLMRKIGRNLSRPASGYANVSRRKSVWNSHTAFELLNAAVDDSNRLFADYHFSQAPVTLGDMRSTVMD